jgi:hypothetical protein
MFFLFFDLTHAYHRTLLPVERRHHIACTLAPFLGHVHILHLLGRDQEVWSLTRHRLYPRIFQWVSGQTTLVLQSSICAIVLRLTLLLIHIDKLLIT